MSAPDPERGRVLIVDDETFSARMLARGLGDEFEILFAASGGEALEKDAATRPDIILLDGVMPDMDGYQACARLKADRDTADIPVVFVTGLSDPAAEARGLELGAVDFLHKPVNPPITRARVRNHIELKRARDRLRRLAVTDGLTGLANRRCFDETLDAELRRLARSGGQLALIMLDVDHFKAFNDRYGHVEGDGCLRAVAGVLAREVRRAPDLAARYGGEEFVCVLPGSDLAAAQALAETLRQGIASLAIAHERSSAAPHVTASFGVAGASAAAPLPATLIEAADGALYRAKQAGRNRVSVSL